MGAKTYKLSEESSSKAEDENLWEARLLISQAFMYSDVAVLETDVEAPVGIGVSDGYRGESGILCPEASVSREKGKGADQISPARFDELHELGIGTNGKCRREWMVECTRGRTG